MAKFPTTAALIAVVQAFKPDNSMRAATMFPVKTTVNNFYEFDVVEGNRGKTIYRNPDGEAGVIANIKRTRKEIKLPTLREKKTFKESILRWMDGAGKKKPADIMKAIAEEFKDLDDIFERTHEYARWQLLVDGTMTLTGDYSDHSYDFGLTNTATAAVPWSTIATSDPIGNLIAWREMVEKASGQRPTEIWLSDTAIKYIFESTKALLVLGEKVKDKFAAEGTVLKLADMKVIPFNGGYRNDADAFKYYLSDDGVAGNMALVKVPGTIGVTAKGGVVDSDAPPNHKGKFAKSWTTKDPSARWILECETCMPGILNINNFGSFTLW